MLIKLMLVVALITPMRSQYTGFAAAYSPGMMQRVGRHRGMHADCMVAHTYHPLGTWVQVLGQRTRRSLRCLVVDVPQPRDRARIIRRRIIVELSFEDNRYICGFANEPVRKCPVTTRRIAP